MEKFRTSKMKDRLRDEESDLVKQKKRDGNNVLLSSNMKKIIQEESKTNSNLNQVGMTPRNVRRYSTTSDHVVQVVRKPYGGVGSGKKRSYGHDRDG